ncbi:5-formyltetrahydrofolate cyclo-ligase [Pradoshia sp.]
MSKNRLRSEYLRLLADYPKDKRSKNTYHITDSLVNHSIWKEHHIISITLARYPEIDTSAIIERAWADGKQMVIPKCKPKTREMDFYLYEEGMELKSVYNGLLEPNPEKAQKIDSDCISLVIVPGLAFTSKGYRLGFGGGYYDRFLAGHSGDTLSLAFSEQVTDQLPLDPFDLPVGYLLTERGLQHCD